MPSVFLSIVNSEFTDARNLRVFGLQRAGFLVRAQPNFPHTATDTLHKLNDLISDCDCMVHLVGQQTGSLPNHRCLEGFLRPALRSGNFLAHEGEVLQRLKDGAGISYTQWEAILALHHRKPLLVYANGNPHDPLHPQRAHLDLLKLANVRADLFDEKDLGDRVLADVTHLFRGGSPPPPPMALEPRGMEPRHPSPDSWF